ncbi:MAG TPA: Hsp33 family molecular chaperone HslO [Steroidobacteraceae bacterium]|jgi:molecular chaperone Hsp33|nr:Hsp33 family molecular chaperone HslO [Steroidobacteraceae bacterium]
MKTPATLARDQVRRFIFENQPVRGHWVHLESAWRELHAHAAYPRPVTELLGEAVVASVLLAATLKFRGTLTFQLQGNGAVSLLVAQCTHDFRVRAVARCDAAAVQVLAPGHDGTEADAALFRRLTGDAGLITVTVEADEKSLRYQGVVPLSGASLAESLEAYFASSEQLPTRVLLRADEEHGAGMLVQKLPAAEDSALESSAVEEAWLGAQRGIARLGTGSGLREHSIEELLAQGFPGHDLRLFRGTPVRFECRCSEGRVAGLLRALGPEEVRDVLREQGSVTVTCEFCHRPYRFDSVDVEALFAHDPDSGTSKSIH